jgi:hypothetical protein
VTTTTEPDSDPGSSSAGSDRPAWAEDLKDEILGAVEKLVEPLRGRERQHLTDPGQTKAARGEDLAGNLDQQIAAAIKANDDARSAAEQRQRDDERLGKIEAAVERPPVDRRRVHGFMGWGEPER